MPCAVGSTGDPGLRGVASLTCISGQFRLFIFLIGMLAKRQDGMHVIRAGGAVLQNPPVFMDRKVAAARIMRFLIRFLPSILLSLRVSHWSQGLEEIVSNFNGGLIYNDPSGFSFRESRSSQIS